MAGPSRYLVFTSLLFYGLLTVGTYEYVKDTTDAKNAEHVFRFGSAMKKMCDLEGNVEVFTPLGCYFMSFSPFLHMYLSLSHVCRYSLLYSLPCVILITTYKLPNLENEPVFSWGKKSSHHCKPIIAFFQDYSVWGRYIYLACINVCMLSVFLENI